MNKHILALLLVTLPAHGAYQRVSAGMYRLGQVANVGLTFGLAARMIYVNNVEADKELKTTKELPDLSVDTGRPWCDERIKECGIEPTSVGVKTFDSVEGTFPETRQRMATLWPALTAESTIICHNGVMPTAFFRHELGHVYYKDAYVQSKNMLIGLGACGLHAASMLLRKKMLPATIPASLMRTGSLVLGGYVKGVVATTALPIFYHRFIEYRADQFAIKHASSADELRAAAILVERAQPMHVYQAQFATGIIYGKILRSKLPHLSPEQRIDLPESAETAKNIDAWWSRHPQLASWFIDPAHPDPLDRARYFREAADALEAKQK